MAEAVSTANGGLEGDLESCPERGVTLLTKRQWAEVQKELGVSLPWHTRRANIAIDTAGLRDSIGKRLRVGEMILRIDDETRPCDLMDRLHPGLKLALTNDCRGGVHGQVERAGRVKIGDPVEVLESA